jgi:hypothetical protein
MARHLARLLSAGFFRFHPQRGFQMAARIIFDSLDEVPESLKDKAKEKDGKFEMDAKGVIDKNTQLLAKVAAHKAVKDELDALKAKLGESDLDELLAELTALKARGGKTADVEAEIKALEEKHKREKEKALKPLQDENARLKTDLRSVKVDQRVKAAMAASGVNAKYIDAAYAVVRDRFDLSDDGKLTIRDTDGDTLDMTPEKFFGETFKEQMPIFYPPSGAQGSGAPSSSHAGNGGGKVMKRSDFVQLPPATQAAKMKEGFTLTD